MKQEKSRLPFLLVWFWLMGVSLLFFIPEPFARFGGATAAILSAQTDQVAAGSRLFTPTCDNGYCHGKDGAGGSAPTLRGKKFTPEYLLRVISGGISGTPMPAFKNSYSKTEIQQLATYVEWLSKFDAKTALPPLPKAADNLKADAKTSGTTGGNPTTENPVAKPSSEFPVTDAANLRGDARAGQALFFDSAYEKSCRACHVFQDRGGKLGPDLTDVGKKPARELFQLIVIPHTNITGNYATLIITTKDGQSIIGLKREEDEEAIKLYDTSTLPPVSRTIQKANVAKIEQTPASIMPTDYASRYTLKQVLDLIAFLKSGDPSANANVSLKDLFH